MPTSDHVLYASLAIYAVVAVCVFLYAATLAGRQLAPLDRRLDYFAVSLFRYSLMAVVVAVFWLPCIAGSALINYWAGVYRRSNSESNLSPGSTSNRLTLDTALPREQSPPAGNKSLPPYSWIRSRVWDMFRSIGFEGMDPDIYLQISELIGQGKVSREVITNTWTLINTLPYVDTEQAKTLTETLRSLWTPYVPRKGPATPSEAPVKDLGADKPIGN